MKLQSKFAIAIPTINRKDLLHETLLKYRVDFPNTLIYVTDNGKQGFEPKDYHNDVFFNESSKNLGVAASWNLMINDIFHATYNCKIENVLVLNDDIYLGKTEQEIIDFIDTNKFSLATTNLTWCAFILSRETFEKIGSFDENIFPAYFEDNDYAYRLKLAEVPHSCHEFLNPKTFINSGSIAKNPSLNLNFEKNRQYFISKWGGEPHQEQFLTPFNK